MPGSVRIIMRQDFETKASLQVGQVYEGQSKPAFDGRPTKRVIVEIKGDRVRWEPVGRMNKYRHEPRENLILSFLQWADRQLVDYSDFEI